MEWLVAAPIFLSAVGFLYVPGLLVGSALRLRGLALFALAPVGSVAVLAVLAIVYGAAGVAWSALSASAGVAIIAVLAWGLAHVLRVDQSVVPQPRHRLLLVGVTVGGVLGALRFAFYVGDPAAISQTNDAVFHLNALRWVLETGSASSLDLSGVIGASSFYPAAWHAIASLVALGDPSVLPVAANMTALVVIALIWPTGVAWLTQVATRGHSFSAQAAVFAAALSSSLVSFPLLMFQWGVLYPYALGVALLPAALAVTIALPRWADGVRDPARRRATIGVGILLILASIGALALAQPAAMLAWAALAASWGVVGAVGGLARSGERLRAALTLVLATVALGILWYVLSRGTSGSHWPPFRGKLETAVDILGNGPLLLPPAWAVSALMLGGLVVAVRRPDLRWLVIGWVGFSGLYAIAAAIGHPLLRRWVLGPWYADPYRLGALLPVVVIPLAAIGLAAFLVWVAARSEKMGRILAPSALGVIAAVGVLSLALQPVVQMPKVIEGEWDNQTRYAANDESFLSPDERELLERLDEEVPETERVIGNPSTGTGYGYLLSGRDVYPRTWSAPRSAEWAILAERLRDVAVDPDVCDALAMYGSPEYVLDFGEGEQTAGRYLMPGFTDLSGQDGFELVDREGDASLWRITACAP